MPSSPLSLDVKSVLADPEKVATLLGFLIADHKLLIEYPDMGEGDAHKVVKPFYSQSGDTFTLSVLP